MIYLTENAVDFFGYEITSVEDDDGAIYVPLKRLCEILGVDHKWQLKKVKSEEVFNGKILSVPGKDGRHRRTYCLPFEKLYFWLFRVDPNTVRTEIIETILEYRTESVQALRHYELYGLAMNPRAPAEEIESRVRESLERTLTETFQSPHDPEQRRFEVFRREISMFEQFDNEAPPYREKAHECIGVAIDRYNEWMTDYRKGCSSAEIH